MRTQSLLFAILIFSNSFVFSQVVCVGSVQKCADAQARVCAAEKAQVNLEVTQAAMVSGIVKDQTGAAFSDDAAIQLRNPGTGVVLRTVPVAHEGTFDLGSIDRGKYRLIVVRSKDGKITRLAPFDQPANLKCGESAKCSIELVLTVDRTDNVVDLCPPK